MALGEQMFQSPAAVVNLINKKSEVDPRLTGFSGVQHMVTQAISSSDVDIRRELFNNIVLCGGGSMLKGFSERLQRCLPDISPQSVKVKVTTTNDRRFQAWVGGSILSSLGSFQQMWMSRQEYKEHGAIFIERKCP